ncbi:hypothetical protein [Chitinimonas sp.]|uniref:hypothetical protein n=1 Tax=Chitinimonas sp. TaxID=1934313 RepID=UPI002F92B261
MLGAFFALTRYLLEQGVYAWYQLLAASLLLLLGLGFSFWSWALMNDRHDLNLLHPYAYYLIGGLLLMVAALVASTGLRNGLFGVPILITGGGIVHFGYQRQVERAVQRRKQRLREQQQLAEQADS